jgi:hypothetical protein
MLNADFICDRPCTANDVVQYHLNRRNRLTLLPLIRVKIALQDSVVPGPVRIGSAGDERF